MTDNIEFSNGNRVFRLLIDKIEGVHEEVREARKDVHVVQERTVKVETRLDHLPCPESLKRVAKLEGVIARQTMLASIIGAVTSGLVVGVAWLSGLFQAKGGG